MLVLPYLKCSNVRTLEQVLYTVTSFCSDVTGDQAAALGPAPCPGSTRGGSPNLVHAPGGVGEGGRAPAPRLQAQLPAFCPPPHPTPPDHLTPHPFLSNRIMKAGVGSFRSLLLTLAWALHFEHENLPLSNTPALRFEQLRFPRLVFSVRKFKSPLRNRRPRM